MIDLTLPLTTERLTLRLFGPDDVEDMFAYQGREEVARYLYRPARTRAQCADVVARISAGTDWQADGDSLVLAIRRRTGGEVVGEIVLRLESVAARQTEIGWVLHPAHEGNGYATEAAHAVAALAFDRLGTHRLYARLDVENTGSVRLCERLGMRREAHLIDNDVHPDGRWGSEYVYAIRQDEFK
ncbi:GNAT family N-acetyltransferase [Micromonospora sp. NPDC051925]|uniref:GNAT family N-acetyltransferase n=1 Tax=Micromonospora sp. NPDC051925 TaxID=3364288 RepID=UPI0037CB2F97